MKSIVEPRDVFVMFHQKLVVAFRSKFDDLGFTLPQIETLRFIIEKGNPTMKNIADYFSIAAPSATFMVEQLFSKKLIKRQVNPKDRRTVRIVPTPKAAELFEKFKGVKNKIFSDMLKVLSEDDRKQLTAILKKLVA